jgi:hypothetical protein
MSRRERWAWAAGVLLLLGAARLPLHRATFGLPVSNDDAIPLMMAERILHGELSTILWNQPYNGALDAYLLAPGLLVASPHMVFRVYEAACGLALVAMAGLLAAAVAGERGGWIAAILAAAGTPYMGLMAALGPTPNFLVPLLVGLVTLAGYRSVRTGPNPWCDQARASGNGHENENEHEHEHEHVARSAFLVGVVAGLAVWDSFLALPALLGAVAGLVAAGVRPPLRAALWIAAGAAIGAAPLLAARLTGASGATPVTALRPRWLWGAGVQDLLRAARGLSGIDVPLVIDGPERAALPGLAAIVLVASLAISLVLGATRRRSLPLTGWAIALAVAFAFSRRTGGDEVRYLFGAALPVIALCGAGVVSRLHSLPRVTALVAAAAMVCGLLVPWFIGHRTLLASWRDPGHAVRVWQVPPLDPAIGRLRDAGIRSAYASLQFAGRITVESGHGVIASQAWNERIPGDPLRYRDEVDLDPRPAWVLSPVLSRGMPRAGGFRQLLSEAGGAWSEDAAGDVTLFHGFRPPYDESRPVPPAELRVTTMDGAALPVAVLDRDRGTQWTSSQAVARGGGVVVSVPNRRRLSAIVFLVSLDPTPLAASWVAEADGVVVERGPARYALQWVNGAPRAGRQALLVIPLRDRSLQEVRVIFQDAGPPLTLAEVFAYGPDEAPRPAAGAAAAAAAYERARGGDWAEAERLYGEACRLEPERASHHAAAVRAGWRAARRRLLDVESLGDGGAAIFERR